MEKRQISHSILRKWWLVAILALLGGGIGLLSLFVMKPIYKADLTLYITNRNNVTTPGMLDLQDLEVSRQLVLQYTDILTSRSVTSKVLSDLQNEQITEKELLSVVSITSKKDSDILTISALWPNPTVAATIANSTGREFIAQVQEITNSKNVEILDPAIVPDKPVSNKAVLKILLGIIAGTIAAYGSIYIFEYFDSKVRLVEDIENRLQMPVIGVVPDMSVKVGGYHNAEKDI
jgi:capsular polysaccharide biosynthesis protein